MITLTTVARLLLLGSWVHYVDLIILNGPRASLRDTLNQEGFTLDGIECECLGVVGRGSLVGLRVRAK
jgi:hypothetical protein